MFRRWLKVMVLLCIVSCLLPIHTNALSKGEYAKQLPYWVEIDLTHKLVIVYSNEDDSAVRIMICSPGIEDGLTPTGTYYMPVKEKNEERGPWYKMSGSWVRYATRIYKGVMTHSILYRRPDITSLYRDTWKILGTDASHGCLRLAPVDAQWIAYNCDIGTKVVIHKPKKSTERKQMHDQIKASMPEPAADGTLGEWEAVLSPTPAPLMEQGTVSYHIEALQQRLQSLGFFSGSINGKYEESTALAVMNFQEAMGYEATGVVDSELLELVYAPDAAIGTYVTIRKKDSTPVVQALQEKLTELGYYSGKIDGIYAESTRDAVQAFCRDNGLSVSDEVIPSVQKKIFSSGVVSTEKRTPKPSGDLPYETPKPESTPAPNGASSAALSSGDSARIVLDKEGSSLYLRATESKDSDILAQIPHHAYVDILEPGKKYHKVLYEGIEGYASAKYIFPNP